MLKLTEDLGLEAKRYVLLFQHVYELVPQYSYSTAKFNRSKTILQAYLGHSLGLSTLLDSVIIFGKSFVFLQFFLRLYIKLPMAMRMMRIVTMNAQMLVTREVAVMT